VLSVERDGTERNTSMFRDVPVLGLIYATFIGEFCAALGAGLTVGAWHARVETEGLLVGLLFCSGAIGCGVAAWRASIRIRSGWLGGVVTAGTTLLFVIVLQAKGGFG
jgi:hypothetical protein